MILKKISLMFVLAAAVSATGCGGKKDSGTAGAPSAAPSSTVSAAVSVAPKDPVDELLDGCPPT